MPSTVESFPHSRSSLGRVHHSLQHLQEEFVHGNSTTGFDAVEGGEGAVGRLSKERQSEEEAPGPLWVIWTLLNLKLQQSLVKKIS